MVLLHSGQGVYPPLSGPTTKKNYVCDLNKLGDFSRYSNLGDGGGPRGLSLQILGGVTRGPLGSFSGGGREKSKRK